MFDDFSLNVVVTSLKQSVMTMRIGYCVILCFAGVVIDQANWDSSKVREKLSRDIEAHLESVRTAKLSELTSTYEV